MKGYDQSTVNSIFLHQNRCFQSEKILRFFYVLSKGSLTEFHFQSEKKTKKKKHCVSFMFYVKGNLYYKSLLWNDCLLKSCSFTNINGLYTQTIYYRLGKRYTRVLQKVLSLIGFLNFIPGIF